ncbi:hypothetical protein GCM10019059_11550 [Camelimonas fluminis]|nr:hypothetical protein GCM10019059_11550 [Camelimonas fluminis]
MGARLGGAPDAIKRRVCMSNDWREGRPAGGNPLLNRFAPMAAAAMLYPARRAGNGALRLIPGHVPLPDFVADLGDISPVLGRIGPLEVRLATTRKQIKQAQRLRYRVFYEEMSAVPNPAARLARRDMDGFDAICDHLLVIDNSGAGGVEKRKPKVVGTYRLLRQEVAERHSGFYTASEFDIAPLLARHRGKRFLELGRSCVLKEYRTKRTVELLWQGIWNYVQHHRIDAMFGCASLEGVDPEKLALPLSFLHHFAAPPEDWAVQALPSCRVDMNRMAKEAVDPKKALHALPPLIKGYLRLGASFGGEAVVDRQFGTTDVLVLLPVSFISKRYVNHFAAGGEA